MNRRPRASAGSTRAVNALLRAYPLATPIGLITLGIVIFGLSQFLLDSVTHTHGVQYSVWILVLLDGFAAVSLLLGLLMLPIGIGIAIRRSRHAIPLRCPRCGTLASESRAPFRVERVPGVGYSMVTCPRCRYDFTVDKYAKLT